MFIYLFDLISKNKCSDDSSNFKFGLLILLHGIIDIIAIIQKSREAKYQEFM